MLIDEVIQEGNAVLRYESYEEMKCAWIAWSEKVRNMIAERKVNAQLCQDIHVKLHFVENEYSSDDSKKSLKKSVKDTIYLLNRIAMNADGDDVFIEEKTEIKVIERILENFHIYIKAMYQAPVHGKGTLKQEDLSRIVIGNEYDVQRMLYAVLLTVFPDVRMEVAGDNGYSAMRSDLYLERYDMIIELKCTRNNMTEKKLTEELGADAFHYRAKTLFLFIYDKECVIKNMEAFKMAFWRDHKDSGKTIRMFITQPIRL